MWLLSFFSSLFIWQDHHALCIHKLRIEYKKVMPWQPCPPHPYLTWADTSSLYVTISGPGITSLNCVNHRTTHGERTPPWLLLRKCYFVDHIFCFGCFCCLLFLLILFVMFLLVLVLLLMNMERWIQKGKDSHDTN